MIERDEASPASLAPIEKNSRWDITYCIHSDNWKKKKVGSECAAPTSNSMVEPKG
jgi:hypothetical protein